MPDQNNELLESFTQYCANHEHLRFWQALLAWSQETLDEEIGFIMFAPGDFHHLESDREALSKLRDTFYL